MKIGAHCLHFSELLPKLPTTGLFEIDGALTRQPVTIDTSTVWQYADDDSQWHNFQWYESRILEVGVSQNTRPAHRKFSLI